MTNRPDNRFNLSEEKLELLDLLLADEGIAETAPTFAIPPRPKTRDPLPLSFGQQRLWFLETMTPGSSAYNSSLPLRLTGQLNEQVLARACQALVQRHESLRTTFTAVSGTPQQMIHDQWSVKLETIDLSDAEDEVVAATLQTAVQNPFDLENGPLVRFHLFRLNDQVHIFLLVFHHIVFDGWSAGIVLDELATCYDAYGRDQEPELPDMPIQYADFAIWQRDWLTGNTLQDQLDYWQTQLAGELPILQLPTDKPRPAVKTYRGATESLWLSPQLTAEIHALCQQTSTTPFMVLLAAFNVLLYRYTGQKDILVGTPIANRQQLELAGLVGFFVNTLVLRNQLHGQQSFHQLLAQVRDTATTAYEHQDVPFDKLVELLRPERNLSYDLLFQVMFTYQDGVVAERPLPNLVVTPINLKSSTVQFDLELDVTETADGLKATFHYNIDLFETATIKRLATHFRTLLQAVIAEPAQPIGTVSLLTQAERQQLLVDWNNTDTPYHQAQTVVDRFALQVAQSPQAIAVSTMLDTHSSRNTQLTYDQLNRRANQLAHTLRTLDARPNTTVAVCLERSPEMIVALFGILKAGAAYVPIDPDYPQERIDFILKDTQTAVLLTQASLKPRLPRSNVQMLCLDSDWATIAQADETDPLLLATPNYTAYIIYTSGSTGQPKGVLISHRSLLNYVTEGVSHLDLQPEDVVLQFASISFDTAVEEIFPPLLHGARLLLRNDEMLTTTAVFWQMCAANGVTVLDLPTAFWHLLCSQLRNDVQYIPASLRFLFTGGEKASPEHIQTWLAYAPAHIRLVNGYGPTEATVVATTCNLTGLDASPEVSKAIIGRPIPNTRVYLLNNFLQPVPIGVWGELYIAGVGLAQGYLNRPRLTAVSFIPDLFSQQPGARLYKTGDVARYLANGYIEYQGRLDHQVKIRGFRIEPGEIELALVQHPLVQEVIVIVREDQPGQKQIAAYYTSTDPLTRSQLRQFLEKKVPIYMIPTLWVWLDSFPLTTNGKIDRKALPLPDGKPNLTLGDTFLAPQNALESQLAQIWQEILNLPAIGTNANYFEIGGHSLQAVTLFAAIEKRLKVRLPVSLLFEAPTIGQLAVAMRQRGDAPRSPSLVPIQPLGMKTPLFCVHGGAGHVFHYHDLAQLLGTERPFYGLQPQLDETTHRAIYLTVEQMAAHYIEEMKTVQPSGPYLLSGFCFGGIVVYEMAQQLVRAGDEVGLLVFIDPSSPHNRPQIVEVISPEVIAARVARHKKNMAQLSRFAWLGYILNSSKNRLMAFWHRIHRSSMALWRRSLASLVQQYINWWQVVPSRVHDFYFMQVISTQATQAYQPQRYPGQVFLFYSTLENSGDESLGWSDLPEGGLKMFAVESTHLGILKRPSIDQVAAQLKQYLEPFA